MGLMGRHAEVNAGFARLARLERDSNVPGLIVELGSDVRGRSDRTIIRAHAARILGRLRDARAIPHLVALAHDPEEHVRFDVFLALGRLKTSEVDVLFEGVMDSSALVRMAAAEALGRVGDTAAIPKLREVLDGDRDKYVRLNAAEALAMLGDQNVRARVPEVVRGVPWRVRRHPRWRRLNEFAETGGRLEPWQTMGLAHAREEV